VELLGEELERACVGEVRQPRHLFQIVRDPPRERSLHVLLGDLVFGDHGRVRAPGQLVPGFLVELAGRLPAVHLLKRGNCFAHVLAGLGVDQSRRNGGPVEQNLRLEYQKRIQTWTLYSRGYGAAARDCVASANHESAGEGSEVEFD
jgi:hypothetical protein